MIPSDPEMFGSYINLQLRDYCAGLEDLCDRLDIGREELEEKIKNAGFVYDAGKNQLAAVRKPGGIC